MDRDTDRDGTETGRNRVGDGDTDGGGDIERNGYMDGDIDGDTDGGMDKNTVGDTDTDMEYPAKFMHIYADRSDTLQKFVQRGTCSLPR